MLIAIVLSGHSNMNNYEVKCAHVCEGNPQLQF